MDEHPNLKVPWTTPPLTCFNDIMKIYLVLFPIYKWYSGEESLVASEATSRQVVVKLELMRVVAENSRKQNVVFRYSNTATDSSAISNAPSSRCNVSIPPQYLEVADLSIGVSRGLAISLVE